MATKRMFTATSPDGQQVTVTSTRDVKWLTWAAWDHDVDYDDRTVKAGEWFHVGTSTSDDKIKASKAAKGTNPYFNYTAATPATEI